MLAPPPPPQILADKITSKSGHPPLWKSSLCPTRPLLSLPPDNQSEKHSPLGCWGHHAHPHLPSIHRSATWAARTTQPSCPPLSILTCLPLHPPSTPHSSLVAASPYPPHIIPSSSPPLPPTQRPPLLHPSAPETLDAAGVTRGHRPLTPGRPSRRARTRTPRPAPSASCTRPRSSPPCTRCWRGPRGPG